MKLHLATRIGAKSVQKIGTRSSEGWIVKRSFSCGEGGTELVAAAETLGAAETRSDAISDIFRAGIDAFMREFTAFGDLDALLNAPGGYYPTCRVSDDPRFGILADVYDHMQSMRGDPRRAYRG